MASRLAKPEEPAGLWTGALEIVSHSAGDKNQITGTHVLDDGRVRKVLLTAKGQRFMEAALTCSARLEREAAEKMGEGRVRELRTLLTELGAVFSKTV
jgi:hypothetical protein